MNRMFRNAILVVAAVIMMKVAVTEGGVAFSLLQFSSELTTSEAERRQAYQIVIGFSVLALMLALVTGLLIFRQGKRAPSRKLAYLVAGAGVVLYGTHLVAAFVVGASNPILSDFMAGFAWVSVLGLAIVFSLLALSVVDDGRSAASVASAP